MTFFTHPDASFTDHFFTDSTWGLTMRTDQLDVGDGNWHRLGDNSTRDISIRATKMPLNQINSADDDFPDFRYRLLDNARFASIFAGDDLH